MLEALVRGRPSEVPRREEIEAWLGVELKFEGETGGWRCYEAAPAGGGPIARVDARFERGGGRVFVVLVVAASPPIHEAALGLVTGTELPQLDIQPQIPPEGTVAYIFGPDSARVCWQFTAKTRRLRNVSIAWSAHEGR